jgi:predicted RNase H-like nuclease (RuvC/YqgF family)
MRADKIGGNELEFFKQKSEKLESQLTSEKKRVSHLESTLKSTDDKYRSGSFGNKI